IDYYGATIHDVYSGEGKASDHHYLKHENGEPISWRYLLEQIGDKLQEIDPLVLLRFVDKQVDHPYLVVPDLRTEPQAQWIRSRGGIIVYVKRDEAEARAWKEMEGPEAHHTKVFFANTK